MAKWWVRQVEHVAGHILDYWTHADSKENAIAIVEAKILLGNPASEFKIMETFTLEELKGDKGDKGDKAETKKDKAETLTDGYVRVRTVGNIEVLRHPETKKYAISNGKFMGGKGKDGYWLTRDGKVVTCNPETGKVEVTDGRYTVQREGTTYTVTRDNKVIAFNEKNGDFKVSDGH